MKHPTAAGADPEVLAEALMRRKATFPRQAAGLQPVAEAQKMRRELMEEMVAFACRGFSHPRRDGEVEQLDHLPESRIVEAENEKLKDR